MGTLNAIYIRTVSPRISEVIADTYASAYTEPGSSYWVVEQTSFICPESDLRSLSLRLMTDVFWLSFQSVVDSFQYFHWQNGKLVRSLSYGVKSESLWDRVEGSPEEWEAAAFFSDPSILLQSCNTEDEKKLIERIYRERIIQVGAFEPMVNSRESARAAAKHFRFPGGW